MEPYKFLVILLQTGLEIYLVWFGILLLWVNPIRNCHKVTRQSTFLHTEMIYLKNYRQSCWNYSVLWLICRLLNCPVMKGWQVRRLSFFCHNWENHINLNTEWCIGRSSENNNLTVLKIKKYLLLDHKKLNCEPTTFKVEIGRGRWFTGGQLNRNRTK